ncbi:response regulator receiver protein [filamentous cyanobacterium CCP1]|nr:response regulator receiver protein [filamentous cyanobacterium CCP2]PSB67480.1 response regulator receiver protein [filamentous cyanobacterium CCP1]
MNCTIVVIDDHELVLDGTVNLLKDHYPNATIQIAQTRQTGQTLIEQLQPDLVVVDLSIPESEGATARFETGIELLKFLMQHYPTLNIVVQSMNPKPLVRLKPMIDDHEGGFTIADKKLRRDEMLTKLDMALNGGTYLPKEMKLGLEVKPEWLELLRLAYQEGLQDKAIAKEMNISDRTVRNYWTKVQDALSVYPEDNQNLRTQVGIRAREEGLID